MPFNDYRTALVTGANTGMGATITETFTKRGLTVHGVARNAERLDEVAGRTGMTPLAVDVTDTAALTAAVAGLEIDILVNNAGVSATGNILGASADSVDAMVDVNLRAVLHLCRLLLPGMIERDLGHIVNISSIAGLYNFYGHTAYHATKAAVTPVVTGSSATTPSANEFGSPRSARAESKPRSSGETSAAPPKRCRPPGTPTTKGSSPSRPRTSPTPSSTPSKLHAM